MTSTRPRNQKLAIASRSGKLAVMRANLSKDLSSQYGIRTVSVRKGDTVSVVRGDYAGHEGKVNSIILRSMRIIVEGINQTKLDGTNKPVAVNPSKVKVTKLDLSDKRRKRLLEAKGKGKSSSREEND